MKPLGSLLMVLGLLVGIVLGTAVVAGVRLDGVPLLVAIGLGKLTFLASLGLMGAGATLRRLAHRQERRELPAAARPDEEL